MPITLTHATTILGKRTNKLLAAVGLTIGLDDFNDPIATALRDLGYAVSDPTTPTDSELAAVTTDEENQFFDTAEVRMLETILNEIVVKVTIQVGPRRQQYSDIAERLERLIQKKRDSLTRKYGVGLPELVGGTIALRFAETNET